jgi:SAM-dependent methyltransferase
MSTMSDDMRALKTKLKATWEAGDYGRFAQYLEPGAVEILQRLDIAPGTRMLDVGCGAGQIAIPAARAGVQVTGIDLAANQVAQARARAEAEKLDARFDEGDAEALPYGDARFDIVVSLIGAMFAPRPELVAAELVRVCRPGGRIAMVNWTPGGFIGQMFKVIASHVPPPAIMPSPLKWGDEATVRERFGDRVRELRTTTRTYPLNYPFPPADVVEFFRAWYGPTNRAFAAAGDKADALRADLVQLWSEHNRATDGSTAVASECLEVTARRA